jgi:hypothetical protein
LNADGTENYDFLDVTWRDMCRAQLQPAERIYGVRKSYIKTVEEEKNWVCIYDVLEEIVQKFDTAKIEQYIIRNMVDTSIVTSYTCNMAEGLTKSSPFRKAMAKYEPAITLKVNSDIISAARRLLAKYGQSIDFNKMEEETQKEYKNVMKGYPMLDYFSGSGKEAAKAIVEYVRLIDNNTRSKK